jgi:hypothetical protein
LANQYAAEAAVNAQIAADAQARAAAIAAAQANNQAAPSSSIDTQIALDSNGNPITARAQLSAQVKEQVRANEQGSAVTLSQAFADPNHLFAVADSVETLATNSNTPCTLTAGDLLKAQRAPIEGETAVAMTVITAKRGSCVPGSSVEIALSSLQEFENEFARHVESGMEEMRSKVPGGADARITTP